MPEKQSFSKVCETAASSCLLAITGVKKKRLISFLFIFQAAIAFELPIGQAVAVAVAVGQDASLLGGVALISEPSAQQPVQLPDGEAEQSQDSPHTDDHVQQKVLVRRDLVDGRAEVAGAVVPENVADPVHSPAHRVARLVLVDGGQKLGLLAVPVCGGAGLTANLGSETINTTKSIRKTNKVIIHSLVYLSD